MTHSNIFGDFDSLFFEEKSKIDLDSLNEDQRKAVETVEGPLLVLAGAGSGKTRVLTYRIANLIDNHDVHPWQILAITFTNKAAAEMRERLGALIESKARGMWVSTFHSMCVRILRKNADVLGYTLDFTIFDDADSKRLVKEIMSDMDINPKVYPINAIRSKISSAKNDLVVPSNYAMSTKNPLERQAARVYEALQIRLKAQNAFDFDDLLLYTYLLLKNHPDILKAYQDRFKYIMVDEYQDTNHAQYQITKMLARLCQNIMVVGDDDQSIYSWRGADIRNILEFEKDYSKAQIVYLQQNYRSVGNILNAANAVIANNSVRKVKNLFTDSTDGEKIQVYVANDERDEGRWIAGEIGKRHRRGDSYEQMAIFYRTNAQSRTLEDMLLRAGVPYRIVGGTRFFDRAEIKDMMAYLTLVINPGNDMAAKRVINVPKRGVGSATIEKIEEVASLEQISFMDALNNLSHDPALRPSTRRGLEDFAGILHEARSCEGSIRDVAEFIILKSGIITALKDQGSDESLSRVENIEEFLGVIDEFAQSHTMDDAFFDAPGGAVLGDAESGEAIANAESPTDQVDVGAADEDIPETADEQIEPGRVLRGDSLADFIEWATLRTDLETAADGDSAVTMMTVHSAKGLEFDCVFIAGMEETLFPHQNSMFEKAGLEEERRLAYVAITRARKDLHITYASSRSIFGNVSANPASRFLGEIPGEYKVSSGVGSQGFSGVGWEKRGSRSGIAGSGSAATSGDARVGTGRGVSTGVAPKTAGFASGRAGAVSAHSASGADVNLQVGDKVSHGVFGPGVVKEVDGDRISIYFEKLAITKKLLKNFAPITKI